MDRSLDFWQAGHRWSSSILLCLCSGCSLRTTGGTVHRGDIHRTTGDSWSFFFIVFLNTLGSKIGGSIQIIFTVCKMIPLILLIVFGFWKGTGNYPVFSPMIGEGLNPVVVLGQLLVAVLFAFEGWTAVGAIAGELKKPERSLPVAIIGGVSIITAVYCIVNVAYLQVLPALNLLLFPLRPRRWPLRSLGKWEDGSYL